MSSSIVFRRLAVLVIVVLGVAPGCADEEAACDPLALENPCPPGNGFARFCSAPDGNMCVNVCEGARVLPGDSCELDADCDSPLTCDNDRVAVSTCLCIPDSGGRGVFERCEDSTMVYCNNGYDCQSTWAVSAETFDDLYGPSQQECLDTGSCATTEAEECNEGGTYNAANHEACISGQEASNCEVEDVGGLILPVFPAVCDEICVQ